MQIQTFKIYCDIADTESFSKAAALNHITQSAVSQQIRSLEEKYKVMLIERGKKNFSLTQEGKVFLQASREILETYDSLSERIDSLRNVVSGQLRIATVFSIGLHELPPYLKEFRRRFPEVDVKVEYRRSTQVYMDVYEGNVDIGLVAFPHKRKGLKVDLFWRDRLVLICPPDHRLASQSRVKMKQLDGEKFILFEPDLPTRKAIDKLLKGQRVEIDVVMEFDNIETVKRAVEIENGISIVPATTVEQEIESGSLHAVEIDGVDVWRPLGTVVKRNRGVSPAQRNFTELLLEGIGENGAQTSDSRGSLQLLGVNGRNSG